MLIRSKPMSEQEARFLRDQFLVSPENVGYSSEGVNKRPIRVEQVEASGDGKVVVQVAIDLDHKRSVNTAFLEQVLKFIGQGDIIRYS